MEIPATLLEMDARPRVPIPELVNESEPRPPIEGKRKVDEVFSEIVVKPVRRLREFPLKPVTFDPKFP